MHPNKSFVLKRTNAKNTTECMAVAFFTLVPHSFEFFRDVAEEARKLLVCIVRNVVRS